MIYIFWTCKDQQEAKIIVHGLLDQCLIACASIFPQISSIYRWEGKIEEAQEAKIILKSQSHLFDAIQSYIGPLSKLRFCRIPGSFEPSFRFFLQG